MSNWDEQWGRINRYYSRLSRMYKGVDGHGDPAEYFFDDIWSFFQNCWHLKDWLKTSGFCPANIMKTPDEYVDTTDCLKICADLANATKHMTLTRSIKSGAVPRPATRSVAMTGGSSIVTIQATMDHGDQVIDALDLATECMDAWRAYLPVA